MARFLALVCACVLPLSAFGRAEKSAGKDYQKLAETAAAPTPWSGTGKLRLPGLPAGYSYRIASHPKRANDSQTVVSKGGRPILAWDTASPRFCVQGNVLYRAEFSRGAPGCIVVAFDLKAGKELWRSTLRATGVWNHSFYLNDVHLDRFDDSTLIVGGREMNGEYVEIVELKTGKTVGHKVAWPKWMKKSWRDESLSPVGFGQ